MKKKTRTKLTRSRGQEEGPLTVPHQATNQTFESQERDGDHKKDTVQLVCSFVLSRLDYCNATLAGLPATHIARL